MAKPATQERPQRDARLITDTRVLPSQVRLIDSREDIPEDQKNRLVTQYEAYQAKLESGLDLIMISPEAKPPVIKLVDFGKLCYEEKKHQREVARKNRENNKELKEFFFTPNIGDHDLQVKVTHIREALEANHEVKIAMKGTRSNMNALGRYSNLNAAVKDPEFVLRRVLELLGSSATLTVSERLVYANLRAA